MKRIISIILVVMFAFSFTAFADDYDLIYANYDSYCANINVTMTVNEPMAVMNVLSEMTGISNFVDLQGLCESLCDSKLSGVVKFNANSDFTKFKASYEMTSVVPLKINNNFKSTCETNFGMWFDWDITDELNPKMTYIYAVPFCNKYVVMDLAEMFKSQGISVPQFASVMKNYLNRDYINKLNSNFADTLRKNSTINSIGTRSEITVSKDQLANVVCDIYDVIMKDLENNDELNNLIETDNYNMYDDMPKTKDIKKFFEKVKIFDDTALAIEVNKTGKGDLKSIKSDINFSIDKQTIADAFDATINDDISGLEFTISEEAVYSSINSSVSVAFPELNENNSVSFEKLINPYAYNRVYEWDNENCGHSEYISSYGKYIEAKKDTFYTNLNTFVNDADSYGYKYNIDNNDGQITLTEENGKENFTKVTMTKGSDIIEVDSKQYTLSNPVVEKDHNIYVDTDAIKYIFNADMSYFSADIMESKSNIDFDRKSPQCHHTQEEIDSWYNNNVNDYCDHIEYFYINSYYPNSGDYLPLRDTCNEFFGYDETLYDLTYKNGIVTLTNLGNKEKFKTVIFEVNSNKIIIDGAEQVADYPVVECDDTIYIDTSAVTKIFGAELTGNRLYYYFGYYDESGIRYDSSTYHSYNFKRKNPLCTHTDKEIEDDYGYDY